MKFKKLLLGILLGGLLTNHGCCPDTCRGADKLPLTVGPQTRAEASEWPADLRVRELYASPSPMLADATLPVPAPAPTNLTVPAWQIPSTPTSALPDSTAADIAKVFKDFGITLSVQGIATALAFLFIGASYLRKITPDKAQQGIFGQLLYHLALEKKTDQLFPGKLANTDAPPAPVKSTTGAASVIIGSLIFLGVTGVICQGCKSPQLDTTGVYASGPVWGTNVDFGTNTTALAGTNSLQYKQGVLLYTIDSNIVDAQKSLSAFEAWETKNAEALWHLNPGIKHTADTIRAKQNDWLNAAVRARDAYAASPTDANHTALQSAFAVITEALTQAAGLVAQYSVNSNAVVAAPANPITVPALK